MYLKLQVTWEKSEAFAHAEELARVFNARYVTPTATILSSTPDKPLTHLEIGLDGAKDLTAEQWEYIKHKQYSLHFVQPMVLPDEEKEVYE